MDFGSNRVTQIFFIAPHSKYTEIARYDRSIVGRERLPQTNVNGNPIAFHYLITGGESGDQNDSIA